MIEPGGSDVRWDVGRGRWRRRTVTVASVVATNGAAMLVRAPVREELHVDSVVHIEMAGGRGEVVIRHIAPTGDPDRAALVGVEFVSSDRHLAEHLDQLATRPGAEGAHDRWWWQQGP